MGDIVLETDTEMGNELLIWAAERGSKTRRSDGHSPLPRQQTTFALHQELDYTEA